MTEIDREAVHEFGRCVVELVRDPVVAEFTRGPAVPAQPGPMPGALFRMVPTIVDAVTARWTQAASDGSFALRVWSEGHWCDPADDAAASGLLGAALAKAVRHDDLVEEFSRPGSPTPEGADDPAGERWRAATQDADLTAALGLVVPDIVDAAMGNLLDALDNDEVQLQFRTAAGEWVEVSFGDGRGSGGENLGWYVGEACWLDWFAHEPVGRSADLPPVNLRFT